MARSEGRGWHRWSEEQARACLEELARSGTTVAEFARGAGVSSQRIAYWRKRLAPSSPPAFVSVAMPAGSRTGSGAQIEIVAGGFVVRVREDIGTERLDGIVGVLQRRLHGC